MKKLSLFLAANIITISIAFSQGTAINTTGAKADSSAILDLSSTSQGLLIPRMTTAERNSIISPATGLLIINSDCENINIFTSTGWLSASTGIVPGAAGSISGTATVCQSQNGVAYSVPPVSGASNYVWSYSGTGFSVASGNGTSSITANFSGSATSGNLTVYASNACGNGTVSAAYPITVDALPSSPAGGSHSALQTEITWNWNTVSGATGYKWSTSDIYSNATDLGNNTSKNETGLTCGTSYTRFVWAYNACGNSASASLTQATSSCCAGDGTGGSITHVNGKTIHTFTSSGTFTPSSCISSVEVLVVAGGGGGSMGGGGAGGLIYEPSYSVSVQAYTVTVGTGGYSRGDGTNAGNGSNSVFSTLTAIGGGGGGGNSLNGNAGGSGGAGGMGGNTYLPGAGTSGQGYRGGYSVYTNSQYPTGGGGGAGEVGHDSQDATHGGPGGDGLEYSISGSPVYYAGGGGGACQNTGGYGAAGGLGGGGAGCSTCTYGSTGTAGTANTGGGGGGGDAGGAGGVGGSGIVIISYTTP